MADQREPEAVPEIDRPTLIAFYNAARSEIVQRLALREQVVLAALTVSGVVASLAFRSATTYDPQILLLVPLLMFPFTIAFARHNWIIRHIGAYLATELRALLQAGNGKLRDWDNSRVLEKAKRKFLFLETLTFAVLICGPGILVLVITRAEFYQHRRLYVGGVVGSVAAVSMFAAEVLGLMRRQARGTT
jgi:hypothetical protein